MYTYWTFRKALGTQFHLVFGFLRSIVWLSFIIIFCHLCLVWKEGMEWNGKEWKKIILEYSSIPLFGSFNGENEKFIPLFESLSGREWNEYKGTLIPLYSFKTSNFHSSRNREKWEGMELDLMNFLLKILKYPYIFNNLFSNRDLIVILS